MVNDLSRCVNMKKQVELLAILLTLVAGMFSFAFRTLVPAAKATYVEGYITQDTVWTLVDSPFVLSNDVVVFSNATLTIEPSVDVKFGGNYRLIIEGRLVADGANDRIRFTSNKYAPQTGDWDSIEFTGTQLSTLENCVIEYGTNGIAASSGNLELKNSTVRLCQQNGIVVTNGNLLIQDSNVSLCVQNGLNVTNSRLTAERNLIMQNGIYGMLFSGNNDALVRSNLIIANNGGVALTGNVTTGVNIDQNTISANSGNGVLIDADAHSDIAITNDTIASNKNGLYVSTLTSTYVSGNTIAFNSENGFFYEKGSHTTYRNDIYGNIAGMDADPNATVNAEYNYWGDGSGPYNVSLNPTGRGNNVGGHGGNIDFLPFLTRPIGYVNVRPTASLVTDRFLIPPNETVMFFATNSSDEGHVDRYLFDFDDGNSSGWTTLSVFTHKYSSTGTYHANLTVMDDFGAVSYKATVTLSVQNLPTLYATVDVDKIIANEGESVSVLVHVSDGTNAVANASVTAFSVRDGNFSPLSGFTDETGNFAMTFTTPNVADVTNVRIVTRASKTGYADGSGYTYLQVLPNLFVQVSPSSYTVKSEESASITINVRSNGQPVTNAYLTFSSNNGNLSSTTGITNSDGMFSLVFTAPMTTQTLTSTIMTQARKDKFIDGSGNATITVEPKILSVEVSSASSVALSETTVNVTVHVVYETTPIEGALLGMMVENGSISTTAELTNIDGFVSFAFVTPAVKTQTPIILIANASMYGYADSQGQTTITVNPKTFKVTVQVNPNATVTGELANVYVNVTCNEDGKPVSGAWIAVSSFYGNFSEAGKATDTDGKCAFLYYTPQTTAQITVVVIANVSKSGYVDAGSFNTTTVNPMPTIEVAGGFPWAILLAVVIPVVVAVVVVVLIKLKIITISSKEED